MENTKTTALLLSSCALGLGFMAQPVLADDDHDRHRVDARLSGFNEVLFSGGGGTALPVPGATLVGAVSTPARGTFRATIDQGGALIRYRLSYRDLKAPVTQAHIHFGQRHTVGGIVVWLCKTAAAAPTSPAVAALTPDCPASGTVEGTIVPAQVLQLTAQGFAAGDFNELVRAIRAGATYANVHSSSPGVPPAPQLGFPGGEIRGQIGGRDD
jgi:hypothetical protein